MPTLAYALLGLLAKESNTAYQLSRRVRRPLGYFWTARYGQIHPQLRELTEAGLLSCATAPGPGPHDKRVYSITDTGRATLAAWVVEPPHEELSRDELLLKAYCCWMSDRAATRDLLISQARLHREMQAQYEQMRTDIERSHPGGRVPVSHRDFGSLATLRYGIGYRRHRAEWCEWLAAALLSDPV
jgi:DNA-binding PadR family transcriptional regulator